MTLIEDLRSAVGDSAVKTDPALLAPFLLDNRRRFHGSVLCAVYPKCTEDTAAVMQHLQRRGSNPRRHGKGRR